LAELEESDDKMTIKLRTHSSVAVFVVAGVLAATGQSSNPPSTLPDSPGTVATAQKNAASESNQLMASNSQPATPQSEGAADLKSDQKPAGTAAAEKPATTGVAASETAGAAMAPAKQKRSRSLLIKVGAIIGAGVAVGTVAALSSASPSRPPGSH
jgi:hypothetical protein